MPGPIKNLTRITFVLPDFYAGGAQKVLLMLAGGLDRGRFAPSVVVLNGDGPWAALVPENIPVTDLKKSGLRTALPALRRVLNAQAPDIIMSTMGYMNLGVLFLKPFVSGSSKYLVREANALAPEGAGGLKTGALRAAYRQLYARADRVLSPSQRIADQLVEDYGVKQQAMTVLRNPVEVEKLRAGASPVQRKPGRGARFVCVGRLNTQKAYGRMLDMMQAEDISGHITIIGEGPERDMLEDKIAAHGLVDHVTLAGFNANPAPWMAGADALLLPSLWEGLPNVALEALALGTPVIAAPEAGGIGEIASLAKKGAVTLARIGPEFARAMSGVKLAKTPKLEQSLLPDVFLPKRVNASFQEILDSL